jgi:hypothetical protein
MALTPEEQKRRLAALHEHKRDEKYSKRFHGRFKLPCPFGKVPYWSLEEAERQAAHINRVNAQQSETPTQAFRCSKCNLWHTGRPRDIDKVFK